MRQHATIAALGVALGISALSASAGPTPHELREADRNCQFGNKYLRAGNIQRARGYFENALKVLPTFPDAHMGLGHIAMSERQFEKALSEFRTARDGYIDLETDLLTLRLELYSQSQVQAAKIRDEIVRYQRMLNNRVSGNTSWIERKITELEEQVHQLEAYRAPRPDPNREPPGEVYFYIGNALFNLARLEDAIHAWEACRRSTPKFPLVYNNLAVAYWKQRRFAKAIDCLDRAEQMGLKINPNLRADIERAAESRASAGLSPNQ